MQLFIEMCLFLLIAAPLSIMIHEAGHATVAYFCGADEIVISIGIGKKIAYLRFAGFSLIIRLYWISGGSTSGVEKPGLKHWQRAAVSLGGPMASGIMALLFYVIHVPVFQFTGELTFLFNLWIACINFLPFKIGNLESDGYSAISRLMAKE
ncbi:M50 family metallopeptidase [Aciduricibacillus chroicocephali]|uniref:M50 family metallopeptidase n=1 Tax=Aciduricibacillus chroicocephali TaxID=3054939 RepID=A0ABY9KSG3_9BACI|nr:M50 family metallopeptidase [Bacillaceae bacterium 44XB]